MERIGVGLRFLCNCWDEVGFGGGNSGSVARGLGARWGKMGMRVGQEVGVVGLERMMLGGMKWDGMQLGCGVKTEWVVVVIGVEGCHGRVGLMTHAQARPDGLNISFDCMGFTA